jgi:hypothetical protein
MYRAIVVLGSFTVVSVIGMIILTITGQPLPELLISLGIVAGAGLVELLSSPLNRELFE